MPAPTTASVPTCPDYRRCFITEMRRRALESDIIIVNHHLFFADLAVKREAAGAPDAGILPDAAAVIFDEAHELEEVASNYFGLSVSNLRFEELARDIDVLLARQRRLRRACPSPRNSSASAPACFSPPCPWRTMAAIPFPNREEFLEASGDLYLSVRSPLKLLEAEMERLNSIEEAPGLGKRISRLRSELEFLLESNAHNMVYWIERRAFGASIAQAAPHLLPLF